MRYVALCSLLVLCGAACKDDDPHVDPNAQPDAGEVQNKDAGTKPSADAGKDAGTAPTSSLRPSLPRPPQGLPPELRPPR